LCIPSSLFLQEVKAILSFEIIIEERATKQLLLTNGSAWATQSAEKVTNVMSSGSTRKGPILNLSGVVL
jgi:hypothetical protein